MKNGTMYGKRLTKEFARLRQLHGGMAIPAPTDPIKQLVASLLGSATSAAKGARAAARLFENIIDANEIRVSTPAEIAALIGDIIPDVTTRSRALVSVLDGIFQREDAVSLERLRDMGRRDARQYLQSLEGIDPCTVAAVMLWSLGGHAIPVDGRTLAALRKADWVDADAGVHEVQAFLERHISAADAKLFVVIMQKHPPRDPGSAAKRGGAATNPGASRRSASSTRSGRSPKRTVNAKGSLPSTNR